MGNMEIEINSPTSTLKERLINSLVGITPTISALNKVVFVDTNNTERDSTTSLTFEVESVNDRLKITCSITATASYTLSKIRIYDLNNVIAFETNVTAEIVNGVSYSLTIYVKVNITPSTNMSYTPLTFTTQVYDVFRGVKSAEYVKISKVVFVMYNYEENAQVEIPVSATNTKLSSTQMKTEAQYGVSRGNIYALCGFKLRNPYNNDFYLYSISGCVDITLPSTISYTETITIQ